MYLVNDFCTQTIVSGNVDDEREFIASCNFGGTSFFPYFLRHPVILKFGFPIRPFKGLAILVAILNLF